jgi:hypothetical protein
MNTKFTDESLAYLTAHIVACGDDCQTCVELRLPQMVARLEAAEAVILDAEKNIGIVNPLAIDVWRELAGKEPTAL